MSETIPTRPTGAGAAAGEAGASVGSTGVGEIIHGVYREGGPVADTKAPAGPIDKKWTQHKFDNHLVNPANRRKLSVIIVGTGLSGGAAAAALGPGGYQVPSWSY